MLQVTDTFCIIKNIFRNVARFHYEHCFASVPEQPSNVRGETVSSSVIRLTWDLPYTPGEGLDSYELYYNDSSFKQNVHVTISPPKNTYLMQDLTPNTLYNIKVAARSSRGEGAYSSIIPIRTLEAGMRLCLNLYMCRPICVCLHVIYFVGLAIDYHYHYHMMC